MLKERVSSGIPNLDPHIGGGFVKGSINLISGGTGSGKTIALAHFLYEGAEKGENSIYISLEQDVINVKNDLKALGFDFDKLEAQKKCKFIYIGPFAQKDIQDQLLKEIARYKAERVAIDSISVYAMALKSDLDIRRNIYTIASLLKRIGCTVLLTSEVVGEVPLDVTSGGGSFSRYGIEEFISDSVITLHSSGLGGAFDRALRIVKMRRTSHTKGPIPMQISNKGISLSTRKQ